MPLQLLSCTMVRPPAVSWLTHPLVFRCDYHYEDEVRLHSAGITRGERHTGTHINIVTAKRTIDQSA